MRRSGTLLIAALALGPVRAAAQDPLTLDRAVQATLSRNATLAAARAGAGSAAAAADQTASARFPRITFSESWQRSNEPVAVFGAILSARRFTLADFAPDALNHPAATTAFRTVLGIDQTVFDGGRQRAEKDAARQQAQAAHLLVDVRSAELAVAVTETFGRVLSAQAGERAADAGLSAAREDHAHAARRRDAGVATDADVLALAVHVADLERRRIQSHGDAAVAIAELNRLMGEPITRDWLLADAADDDSPLPPLDDLLASAAASRPELRRAAAIEAAARAARSAADRALVPQAVVQAATDAAGTSFGNRAPAWVAGVEFRWAFSTGGAELARRRGAAEDLARARAEAEDARAVVAVDVVTAYRRLDTARLRRATAQAAIDQARESQRIVRDRFDAGMAAVNDVLRASTDLLDAEANAVTARVDTLIGRAALARASGRLP